MAGGWIKLNRDDSEVMAYLFRRPNAWTLLSLIAIRARREDGIDPRSGTPLVSGEALIGDYETCGFTRQQYRTALSQLISTNQITTRTTNKGTIARLINSTIYNINAEDGNHLNNHPSNQKATSKQPLTRSKRSKEDKTLTSSADEESFYLTKKRRKLRGKRLESFNSFWNAFDYKMGKADAADAWMEISDLTDSTVAMIIMAAQSEANRRPSLIQSGKTPKMAQGWISARRWEDESSLPQPYSGVGKPVDPQQHATALEVRSRYGLPV